MKKFLLLFTLTALTVLTAISFAGCNNTENPAEETKAENTVSSPEETAAETVAETNSLGIDPAEYEYIKIFDAPKGDYRQIAYDYMLAMANYKWVAGEDFSITWKEAGDFKVDLSFKKGQTYYGLPYSEQRASLDQFSQFVEDGGTFTHHTYYYEELVGNHCSSSMGLAYQQLIDFPYAGSLKPVAARRGIIKFIDGLEQPEGDTTKSWYSDDVISLNGKDKIFEAYSKMDRGDILGKFITTSGHSRMVSKVEPYRNATGKLIPARSLVYCIEQTNAFDKINKDKATTWWVDHSYSFQDLIDTKFVPLTLEIFHNGEKLKDAYIAMDAKNTPESILKNINGTITSNFPLSYVRATVTDSEGKVVGEIYRKKFDKTYKVNLRQNYSSLNISKLEKGTYTYTLNAGIARGGFTIESFQFTIG